MTWDDVVKLIDEFIEFQTNLMIEDDITHEKYWQGEINKKIALRQIAVTQAALQKLEEQG